MVGKRQAHLFRYIQDKGEVQLNELCQLFPDLSTMTIRRDLEQLEKEGKIQRFRGGVRLMTLQSTLKEAAYTQRMDERSKHKLSIAQKAASLLGNARSIYIDSGTTCVHLASVLPNESLFVLTPAPYVAMELLNQSNIRVNLTGGQLNRDSLALSGSNALSYIKSLNIDLAFIGTSACSLKNGLTCGDYQEAELKKLIIKKAQKVVCLMDVSKLNYSMPYTFARFRDLDLLVADQTLPESFQQALKRNHVQII